ncbi:MAG: hypothetical protein ACRD1B_10955 [Thermoanaerobaculia bacterium]
MKRGTTALFFVCLAVSLLLVSPTSLAAPGVGTLFGTNASGGSLLRVNTSTGAGTIVGAMGFVAPALAVHPLTGVMYAGRGAGTPSIYTVNPTTGATTLVGSSGLGVAAIGDLTFNAAGVLYASVNIVGDGGTGSETLATINITTGVATVIGSYGTGCPGACTIDGMEGISFDNAGTLWGVRDGHAGPGTPGLYRINTSTGAATFVAPIVGASIVSLQFATDGTLYGGTGRSSGAATDGGFLVTINTGTGALQFLGPSPATGGTSLGALAFQFAGTTVPTLSPRSLAALAVLLVLAALAVIRMRS